MKMFLSRLSNTRSHSDNNYVTRWNGVYFRSRTTSHVVDVRISRGKSKTSLIVLWFIINRRRINGIDIDSVWWIIEWINRPFESRWRTPESRQNRERDGKPRNTDSKGSDVKPAAGQFRKETALKADGRFFQLCVVGPTRCFVESTLLFLTCVHKIPRK